MTKQEINEIKKLFTAKNCSITRICGCYVDGEKNKKTELNQAFLALPEEEMFKYFEILRKSLSGSIGKNLLNLDFPTDSEIDGGTQEFLLRLRDSRLKDDALLEQFYNRIIESYEYVGNYLILLIHDAYDVPGRTKDGIEMDDASDEVYEYILACICPVDLSKTGLSYNAAENTFQNRIRDWVVGMPDAAFLFPAFNDRSTDLHSTLYYSNMVRSVDIFIINGDSFINYCSDNDFNYTIYIGQKCKVLRNEKCFIGTLYEVDSNKNTFSIKQNNGEIIEINCADVEEIFSEEEIGTIN